MKKYIFIILTLISSRIFTQVDNLEPHPEIGLTVSLNFSNDPVYYELIKISEAYCYDDQTTPHEFVICSTCGNGCNDCEGGNKDIPETPYYYYARGFGICSAGGGTVDPHYGYGVYKLICTRNNDYCYIDLRDVKYGRENYGGYHDDIFVRHSGGIQSYIWDAYNSVDYNDEVLDNNVIYIWRGDHDDSGEPDYSKPDVSLFPNDYWKNSSAADLHHNNDLQPQELTIFWGRYPDANISEYQLYQALSDDSEPIINPSDFTLHEDELSNTTFHYKYDDISWISNEKIAVFKVKAIDVNNNQSYTFPKVVYNYDNPLQWNECLVLVKQNYPHLFWNKFLELTGNEIDYYKVHKVLTTSSGTQSFVFETRNNWYTDTYFEIDPKFGIDNVEYWVTAVYTDGGESDETNHHSIDGDSYIQWKRNSKSNLKKSDNHFLSQAYPNPFNPTTTITYTIPEKQDVKIRVFDPFGREVAELVNEVKAKGEHSVNFDGSNLASGVYYYTITAGDFKQTKKLMLVK